MKKDTYIKHTSILTAFYVIGVMIFTLLYRNEIITNIQGSIILLTMAFISLLLGIYYIRQVVCEDCKTVYVTMLIIIFFMSFILVSTSIVLLNA
jgi:hypothetical protein